MTRPANTVGGDFYDILPLPDGRVLLALGDVAGKGSPAALLMALLLAMMRTLVDEGCEGADAGRAPQRADRASTRPRSRFITLFLAMLDPVDRRARLRQRRPEPAAAPPGATARYEQLRAGGMALGMFEHATYTTGAHDAATGDVMVMYSDGITEAEDAASSRSTRPACSASSTAAGWGSAKELGWAAVRRRRSAYAASGGLLDDLTVLGRAAGCRRCPSPRAVAPRPSAGNVWRSRIHWCRTVLRSSWRCTGSWRWRRLPDAASPGRAPDAAA